MLFYSLFFRFFVMNMEQFFRPANKSRHIKALDDGIVLRQLHKSIAIGAVQARRAAAPSAGLGARLSGTAHASGAAAHDLHEIKMFAARRDIIEQLLGIGQSMHHSHAHLPSTG